MDYIESDSIRLRDFMEDSMARTDAKIRALKFCHNLRILSGSSGRFGGPCKCRNSPGLALKMVHFGATFFEAKRSLTAHAGSYYTTRR
ncbi:MAG: hypothetical protein A2Z38_00865 [Planctomycetes bacterium RBG_19FT_COMBO_48_8]|nr:MAG: hypothetical protein A2Z38_00865 [Planctomycetes bacterium RBG_19FT_COMBO_48_8]